MENTKSIHFDNIKAFNNYYQNNSVSKVATKAMSKTSVDDVCYDLNHTKKMNHKFSIDIPTMPATNQKSSSRCWIFSSLNILREKIAKDLNLSNFELSQNYISFFDHLEKANYFLEGIIETAEKPVEDRMVSWLLSCPVSDGGWWEMFVGLCQKYGIVPKEAMPENYQSCNTDSMNKIINMQLRQDAIILRKAIAEKTDISAIREMKNDMLKTIFNIISICLGNPPETFDFEYVDNDKNYHVDRNLTPRQFYDKYVGKDLDNIVSILNAPNEAKPYNKTYLISHAGSVVEGKPVKFLNLTMDEMKAALIKQLQNNELAWFTCDCGQFINRQEGIWDTAMYDYETPFSLNVNMSKAEMLDYRQSAPNHAMLITGVNLVDGKPDKWKIENSWGTEKGNGGYYIMSDDWFDKYVYIACVDKKYLTEEQRNLFEQEPVILEPWDQLA